MELQTAWAAAPVLVLALVPSQMFEQAAGPRVWAVGALCRAVSDTLEARFNPVAVRGELSGFSRAGSGHCYFNLKDGDGQVRCAMFRRAAMLVDFVPREGEAVEVRGRLGVYGARGDLQLIAESMQRVGAGALFEQFLQRKTRLEAEGLFDAERKRPPNAQPRGIGIVTSLGAAALHDVAAALARRVPHIPVVLVAAAVQGASAPGELIAALSKLYLLAQAGHGLEPDLASKLPVVDTILLVRGGGSIEDLWAFNDEALARHIAASPVPLVVGIGHETDFTIADFVADLRAPTPTAAAELVAVPRAQSLALLDQWDQALAGGARRAIDLREQRLDAAAVRMGRPSLRLAGQQQRVSQQAQALRFAARSHLAGSRDRLPRGADRLRYAMQRELARQRDRLSFLEQRLQPGLARQRSAVADRLHRAQLQLELLDPLLVLRRGYAWLHDADGRTVRSAGQTWAGQPLLATLAEGELALTVAPDQR